MSKGGKRGGVVLRAWAAAFAIALVGIGASASVAQAVPHNFWGVDPQATPNAEQFERLKRGGVGSVRIPIGWNAVQPDKGGPFVWSGVDALVGGAAKSGIEVLPFVYAPPVWAVPAIVVNRQGPTKAPKNLPVAGAQRTEWTTFVKEAVARYGPNGRFWLENPGVPQRPIRTWQVWNEENFKYFVARPNPAEYGKLVKLTYTAIKSVDPGAKAVLGGMFARPIEATWKKKPPVAYYATDFLDQMYRTTPGIKTKFNGVALHPYTGEYQELAPNIEAVRAVLKKNQDAAKGLWITEMGWSSGPPDPAHNAFAKGIQGQAKQLKGAFAVLRNNQAKWRIKQVYWFSVDDLAGSCNFCDGSGLFGPGFIAKPSWKAYVKFAGGTPN